MHVLTDEDRLKASEANRQKWERIRAERLAGNTNGADHTGKAVELPSPGAVPQGPTEPHEATSLACVRAHIRKVHMQMEGLLAGQPPDKCPHCKAELPRCSPDPIDVDRLSRSLLTLSELERKLSGRPDPGSYRPQAPRVKGKDRLRLQD